MIVSFASLILIPSGVKCIKRYKYIFSKQQFDFCINYKKAPVFNTIYLILGGGIVYCLLKIVELEANPIPNTGIKDELKISLLKIS